jgi:hypothetical protein
MKVTPVHFSAAAVVRLGVDVQAGQMLFSDGTSQRIESPRPSHAAPPPARTPACLIAALCRRGRFIQAPPPGDTGA